MPKLSEEVRGNRFFFFKKKHTGRLGYTDAKVKVPENKRVRLTEG